MSKLRPKEVQWLALRHTPTEYPPEKKKKECFASVMSNCV